ncbi:MAG: AsmA family protein [Kiloniellaceae bacterium]
MKKLAVAFVLLVVLAVGALLVLPSFWDWNAEKGRMAALVKEHTGRDLEIAGNVSLRLLPTPAFAASDVTLTNLEGGSAPAMMTLEELRVSVALMPLLRGEVRVESVTLVKPQVLLEVLPDGRANWQFATDQGRAGAATPPVPAGEAPGAAAPRQGDQVIRVDSFLVEDGTVRYRDAPGGSEETISGLNAEFAADSLSGPFAASGAAVYHGVPLEFDVNTGQLVEAGATALSVSLKLPQAEADATFVGALSRHAELRTLRGRLQSQGSDLARVLRALPVALAADAPALLAQPFTATAEISASSSDAAAEVVRITLGTLSLDGRLAATLGEVPDITATLSAKTVDLDELLALPEQGKPAAAAGKAGDGEGLPLPSAAAPQPGPGTATAGIGLPRGFTASLELGADALLYRGQTVRQLQVAARLEDGTLDFSRAAVQLPGSSEALLRGTLSADASGPRFRGTVEAKSDNLRGLLRWLGVDPAGVPAERLRRMALKTGVEAGADQLVLRNTNVTLDVSRLTGGAAIALRERPGLGVALSVDKINLDAYLPAPVPRGATAPPSAPAGNGTVVPEAPAAPGAAPAGQLLGLPLLGRFDANLVLRVGQLTYRGLPLDGLHLDATLQRGGLVVREFSVADLAGSRGQFTGSLANVDHDASIDGSLDLSVSTLSRLVKVLGIKAGGALPLESFTLSGAVNGNRQELRFDQRLAALGGSLRAAGKLDMTAAAPTVDSILTLDHPDLSVLLGELLRDADIPRGLGPATLKGRLLAAAPDYRLSGLEGTLAGAELLAGDIALSLAGPRPKLTADVSAGRLPLAAVAAPAAATGGAKGADPQAKGASKNAVKGNGTAAGEPRWSRQAIDLAVLRSLDAEVELSAETLLAGKLKLTDARIKAALADGLLDLTEFTAAAYGGALSVTGQADARETTGPGLALTTAVAASDVQLKGLLRDLADTDRFSGPLTLKGTFTTRGVSEAALVSALSGQGTLDGSVTAAAKVEEQAGALVLGILGKKVKEIRGITDSTTMLFSAFAGAPAAIDGSFTVDRGVARSDDLTVRGREASALTQGSADLPAWLIDSRTDVFRDADPQNAYLTAKLKGPLDEPNVAIGGQPFQRSEQPAPEGPAPEEPAGEEPAGAEPASEPPAAIPLKPEEILKKGVQDLLKELGG